MHVYRDHDHNQVIWTELVILKGMITMSSTTQASLTNTAASRIAQQWGVDQLAKTLSTQAKRRAVAKSLGITESQLQQGMQQVVGYTSHGLNIPTGLTGVPRIKSDGTQNFGRPPASKSNGASAPASRSGASKGRGKGRSASRSARPTPRAAKRAAKRSSTPAPAPAVLAGVTAQQV